MFLKKTYLGLGIVGIMTLTFNASASNENSEIYDQTTSSLGKYRVLGLLGEYVGQKDTYSVSLVQLERDQGTFKTEFRYLGKHGRCDIDITNGNFECNNQGAVYPSEGVISAVKNSPYSQSASFFKQVLPGGAPTSEINYRVIGSLGEASTSINDIEGRYRVDAIQLKKDSGVFSASGIHLRYSNNTYCFIVSDQSPTVF
jgi:hypothetical protein